ncbi:MAG TPA: FkbM family methyltransferase [Steroidobacter sp.]|uniref:FkbM family methyltransferase n=1 Tax=Steroidobacter sp. TaxID=1978227 RepID=UPI002EDB54F8
MAIAPKLIRNAPGIALKRLLWSLLRRREFEYEVVTAHGWRISGHTRDWIQRTLYYFGLWEPNLTAWIASRLQLGNVFVDVGANVGYFTLLAARCVGLEGKVVAIEAMPSIFEHLAKHVRDNGLTNTRLVNKAAVGPDSPREVELFWGSTDNIGSTGMMGRSGSSRGVAIAASTLSDILTDDECARARLIKVDVEGVEPETVHGLGLESGRFSKDLELIVEVAHDPERLAQRAWLLDYLRGLGFFSYVLPETHGFRHYAYPESSRERPRRLREPLTRMHNVIFSRIDADQL